MGFDAGVVVRIINKAVRDPMYAINTARHDYDNVETWIISQCGQSAAIGAAAVVIPVVHIPLAFFDVGVLIHKMAYVCQGIAGLRRCPIDKESSEVDMAVILALWTGAVTGEELLPMFEAEARTGSLVLPDKRKVSPKNEFFECPLQTTSQILVVDKAGTKIFATLGGIFLNKLARTLFVRMAAREGAKLAVGFLPWIGATISGTINYKMVEGVARCADVYYTKKRQFLDRNEEKKTAV